MATRLGRRLERKRRALGWSQVVLSKRAGVARTYLVRLESGAKTNPSLRTLRKLAKALGGPVTALLE